MMNPNSDQQPRGNKRKGCGNNLKRVKNNKNKKDNNNNNDDKSNNIVGEGKKEKGKVNFPCKLCKYDHLTHLCSKIEEASRIIVQHPNVLMKPLPHNQNMTSGSSNTRKALSRSKKPSAHDGGHLCVNMVKYKIDVATQSHNYGSS
jgi:hypothetical protein